MVTMSDVAKEAGVSRATVSRVISGHPSISPETRSNVMYWIKKLDYQPNKVAQSLAGNRTNIIGVCIPNLTNPFFGEIVNAIEEEARRVGYSILVATHGSNLQQESNIINTFKMRRVDAIIAIPVKRAVSKKLLLNCSIPVVSITKKMDVLDSVSVSHYRGVEAIVRHFLELGHHKIAYIGKLSSEKYDHLVSAANLLGAEITQVVELETSAGSDETKTIQDSLETQGLKSTAIFAHNDMAACDTVKVLLDLGYSIPEDVSVAGFDNTVLSRKIEPQITSVAQPTTEVGKYAIDIAMNKISGMDNVIQQIELEPRLVTRKSTLSQKKHK